MKIKRLSILCLTVLMIMTLVMPFTASASTVDSNFVIYINSNGAITPDQNGNRKKADDSYTYVNYSKIINTSGGSTSASGPYYFKIHVYGSSGINGTLVDETANYIPTIRRGTKGYVTQLVHEHHSNPYAKLYGEYYNESGFAKGCWSPDSVYESGTTYYN